MFYENLYRLKVNLDFSVKNSSFLLSKYSLRCLEPYTKSFNMFDDVDLKTNEFCF